LKKIVNYFIIAIVEDTNKNGPAQVQVQEEEVIPQRKQSENLTAEQKLVRERDELRELAKNFEERISVLDKNLTVTLAKNTELEEKVSKLAKSLENSRRRKGSVADIHVNLKEIAVK